MGLFPLAGPYINRCRRKRLRGSRRPGLFRHEAAAITSWYLIKRSAVHELPLFIAWYLVIFYFKQRRLFYGVAAIKLNCH